MEKIDEQVSVNLVYDTATGTAIPKHIRWKNRVYTTEKLGLHYTIHRGTTLLHLFAIATHQLYFLLSFVTNTLHWRLEEVADAAASS